MAPPDAVIPSPVSVFLLSSAHFDVTLCLLDLKDIKGTLRIGCVDNPKYNYWVHQYSKLTPIIELLSPTYVVYV